MKKKIIIGIVILACIGCGGSAAYYYNNNRVEVKSTHTQTSTTSTSTKDSTTMISSQNSTVANVSNNSVQAISEGYNNSATSSKVANSSTSQTKSQVANSDHIEQMYEQETKNNTGGVIYMGAVQSYTTTQSTGYTIEGKINGIPYTNIQNGIIYDTNAVIQVGNFGGIYDITSDLGYTYIYYQPNMNSEILAKVTNYFKIFVKGCYGDDWYCVEVLPNQGNDSKHIIGFVKACYLTYGIQTSNKGSITYI